MFAPGVYNISMREVSAKNFYFILNTRILTAACYWMIWFYGLLHFDVYIE